MTCSERLNTLCVRRLSDTNALAMGGWRADGAIWDASDALLKLIGYSRREVECGLVRWTDLTPQEFAPLDEQALAEIREKGSCIPFEKEYIHKDGRRVPVLVGGAAISADITDAGVFFAVDLTERKMGVPQTNDAPPKFLSLTERQRLICLLLSVGETEKHIAGLLNLGLRTVEYDKHRAAKLLGLPNSRVIIWAVENRRALITATRDIGSLPDGVAALIGRAVGELEPALD